MDYRLGLDMGATSIGWAVFDINHNALIDTGVRIFDDGRDNQSKESLCVARRNARGARRLVSRHRQMMSRLIVNLVTMGFLPEKEDERKALKFKNPYELRAKALDEKLELYELGRIFLQLAERKGFKSNRKDDKEEGGKLLEGFKNLKKVIQESGARTYGEYLWKLKQENKNAVLRLKNLFDDAGKFKGGELPFRETYQDEFNQIWDNQAGFYSSVMTQENKKKIYNILFFQRPLREQEEGWCQFEEKERRIPKAHPLFQAFRIWQNVMNLEFYGESDFGKSEREKLAELLKNPVELKPTKQGTVNYSTIKKVLGLDKNGKFNFEGKSSEHSDLEKGMIVDRTNYECSKSEFFAPYWEKMSEEKREELINFLARPDINDKGLSIEEQDRLLENKLCERFGLSEEASKELLFKIPLEDGFGALSEKAIRKILPFMKQGMLYSDACQEAGYHHSVKEYKKLDKLPYYGEILSQSCIGQKDGDRPEDKFGKINNATVHVALNQVRYLVNELIDIYGKPSDIAIEYARDLPASATERLRMTSTRDKNEAENQRIIKEMKDKIGDREYNKRDIQKYKIWKNLGIKKGGSPLERECPFSGEIISLADLLNGQKFQIEHIIPFSRSFDDSLDNKVIATVEANRYKGNCTPYEAFGESKDGYNWKDILSRARKLSTEQQWRFAPDAMKKFEDKEGPIARSLNDTRYMTRLLRAYLKPIVKEEGKETVQAVVGALTSLIREAWGLNVYKNKEDEDSYRALHNHHALDAVVVASIGRNQISETARCLKDVAETVRKQFKDELYKFKDEKVSIEDKKDLKKRIKDFVKDRQIAIVAQYIKCPENMSVPEVLKKVANINISHKPSQKRIDDKHSTVGQLHEESAYGLKSFVDENSLKAKFKIKDKEGGIKEVIKEVTEYIPMFYQKEDKQAYYDAYKEWFKFDGKAKTMDAKTKEEKEAKEKIVNAEQQAIINLREASKKAFKWFVGGNNFCAEIYQINPQNKIAGVPTKDRGEWKTEIISNYNATVRQRRGESVGYWVYKYPNAKRIMTLKRNDMVMATFTREEAFAEGFFKGIKDYVCQKFEGNILEQVDVLFRVKKINSNGQIGLLPHDIAKEEKDTKTWLATSIPMQKYHARKVYVTPAGRIKNA